METERIDLGGGQWWEIGTRFTRGMEKAITRISLTALPKLEINGDKPATPDEMVAQLTANMGAVDIGAIEDAYLLHGTVAYSYGPIVSLEVIDTIDAKVVRQVITRMWELFTPQRLTGEQRQDFFEKPLPHT